MDILILLQLALVAALLVSSAFFSSSETALFSLSANQLEEMRRQRKGGYTRIQRLLNEPRRLIVTILLGNEFTNLLLSSIMAGLVIQLFGEEKSYYNILIATPLLLLFGEITPKAIAVRNNESFARFQAPILQSFALAVTPVRSVVRVVSDKLIALLAGGYRSQSNLISEDMVITLAREAVGEGVLERLEAHYINQVFKFGDATVDDAMMPRSNMLFISHKATPREVIRTIREHKRDKLVIYKEKHDQVVGLLFARDLLAMELKRKRNNAWLTQMARKPMLVPETKSLLELFHQMRAQQISVALVIDEYGGIVGQVTLNDVLEFVFGELPNEKKSRSGPLKKVRLPGSTEVAEFNRKYHTTLETAHGDTLNGLLIHQFGELPSPRVCITIGEVNFTVLKVEDNRITEVLAQSAFVSRGFLRAIKPERAKGATARHTGAAVRSKNSAAKPATAKTRPAKTGGEKEARVADQPKSADGQKAIKTGKITRKATISGKQPARSTKKTTKSSATVKSPKDTQNATRKKTTRPKRSRTSSASAGDGTRAKTRQLKAVAVNTKGNT